MKKKKGGAGVGRERGGVVGCSSGKDEWRFKHGSKGPPIVQRLSVVGEGHFDLPGRRVHGVGRAAGRHTEYNSGKERETKGGRER